MRTPHSIRILVASALALGTSVAQAGIDLASNYGGTWANGSNGGSGFLSWLITNNDNGSSIFAGTFIGDSTAGAGNINTSGVSFGLYANPAAATVNANRAFATGLVSGDVFTFQLALNFDNGIKGFDFFAGADGTVLNFNVGGGAGVSSSKTLTPTTSVSYDYGGNSAVFDVTIAMTSATSFTYNISRTSTQGLQGTLFGGTVSNLTTAPTGFGFYVSGTDSGGAAQNNLYINNLKIVPEPSTLFLIALGSLLTIGRLRSRTRR